MTMVPLHEAERSQAEWAVPTELPPALPAAPEMPETLIPPVLRPWLCDIGERTQIPLDFTAAPAIVALSSVIGRTIGLYPKQHDDWLLGGRGRQDTSHFVPDQDPFRTAGIVQP